MHRNPPGHSCMSHSIPNPTLCSPYAPHYRARHQPSRTTASLLGTVYSHWRCHRKTPTLGKRNGRQRGGEGGSAAQGLSQPRVG